ncbi:MAG TPA: lytic transglycosylase domain-containing protein [Phycisphaerae bacterium]|nr:lytic transglycosylase domain-containing protein [Phycisphaerae bacterium]
MSRFGLSDTASTRRGMPGLMPGGGKPGRSLSRTLLVLILIAGAGVGLFFLGSWLYDMVVRKRIASREEIIRRCSAAYKVPAELIEAVIRVESAGNANAVSKKQAKGLMQITQVAEQEVLRQGHFKIRRKTGEDRFFDPEYNIEIGTAYLRLMIDRFDGDVYQALAAYNMGPTALRALLRKHRRDGESARDCIDREAPKETRDYCREIFKLTRGEYARLPVTGK